MSKHLRFGLPALGVILLASLAAKEAALFPVLKSKAIIGMQQGDFFLLPTNQLLKPWGQQTLIPGRPVDLAFDSKKRVLAVLNARGVLLLDGSTGARIAEIPSKSTSYTGIAFRPGDRELWASEASRSGPDSILIVPLDELGRPSGAEERMQLPGHPVPAGIGFSSDGQTAYVALSRSNTLAVVNAQARSIGREIPVGIAPFGVAVSARHEVVFVSNRGGRRPTPGESTAPTSGSDVVTNPVTGSTVFGTVSAINVKDGSVREIPVGLAPSALALSPDESALAVANGHSDSLSIVNTSAFETSEVKIPAWPQPVVDSGTYLGSQPIGVAFAPGGGTIYVACAGINAIAVVSFASKRWKVEGAIPAGWFPSALALDKEGGLRVVNIKGVGNTSDHKGNFNSLQFEGSLLRIPPVGRAQIVAGSREVEAANTPKMEPSGGVAVLSALGIQYVLLIVKENRTYDQVFGDIPEGNGDPKLVYYGKEVTPNHHALAEEFVLLDNFYTGGAISFDGHQWLMQGFVSDYTERAFAASPRGYAWNMADALTIPPTGFFWQSLQRAPDVRIYGEFCEPEDWNPQTQSAGDQDEADPRSWKDYWQLYQDGKWQQTPGCKSGVPALARFMDLKFPYSSLVIPDQIRVEEFLRELHEHETDGRLPNLMVLTLNNDHTNGTRPGSPTPRAMVADNDLALGRIVEGMSKSHFWPRTLILVVEDDAQNGVDHVDGHRTVALAIGPHIRRGKVDSHNYNHESMIRTIQEIFRIPQRTRFLAGARAMHSIFTVEADRSSYTARTPKIPLDEMNPPLNALSGRRLWAARQSAAMDWSAPDDVPQDVLNRILWWDSKGYDKKYPVLAANQR